MVPIKDVTYRAIAAYTLAGAYSRKGDRASVDRLIAGFTETDKRFNFMMTAAHAWLDN